MKIKLTWNFFEKLCNFFRWILSHPLGKNFPKNSSFFDPISFLTTSYSWAFPWIFSNTQIVQFSPKLVTLSDHGINLTFWHVSKNYVNLLVDSYFSSLDNLSCSHFTVVQGFGNVEIFQENTDNCWLKPLNYFHEPFLLFTKFAISFLKSVTTSHWSRLELFFLLSFLYGICGSWIVFLRFYGIFKSSIRFSLRKIIFCFDYLFWKQARSGASSLQLQYY